MRDSRFVGAKSPKVFTQPIATLPTLDADKVADGLSLRRVASCSVSLSAADAAQKLAGTGSVVLYFWEPLAAGSGAWLPLLPALAAAAGSSGAQGQHLGEVLFAGHLESLVVYPVAKDVTLSGSGSGDTANKVKVVLRPSTS
jgi:hypothetical protein